MKFALTALAVCVLITGCASESPQVAEKEETYEITGSHLKRKRAGDNVAVMDREAAQRERRPAANVPMTNGR